MTDKPLTWAEFVKKYKPKDGNKFLDDRGNEWEYLIHGSYVFKSDNIGITEDYAHRLTCPLIPPKQARKMWPCLTKVGNSFFASRELFASEEQAKVHGNFYAWPAVPNADGSYSIEE